MKKTLVALAAITSVSAFAQSTVSITGLVDTGYLFTNVATGVNTKAITANGTGTTVLNLLGTEDLGGGLTANFRLQLTPDFVNGMGLDSTTLNAAGTATVGNAQEAFLGLSSAEYGTLKMGRVNSNALDAWGTGSVFGTAIGSGFGSNGNIFTRYSATATHTNQTAPTRFNNATRYESPSINGVSASYLYVPASTSTASQSVVDYGVKYTNGPLNINYAGQKIQQYGTLSVTTAGFTTTLPLSDQTNNQLTIMSANYAIGNATLYAASWTEKQNTSTAMDTAGQMFGAKYAMGATTFLISTGKSNEKSTANVDKKITGYGVDYAMSKRTNLYARFDNRDADTNTTAATAAAGITKRSAVGIKHTF